MVSCYGNGLPGFHRGLSLNDITLDDEDDTVDGMCYMFVTCTQ